MPEIVEAQALLAALAKTDEVKARGSTTPAAAASPNSLRPGDDVGQGICRRGNQAAFSRATELAAKTDDFAERFAAAHFQWTSEFLRGELRSARELASSFLKEAEDTGRIVEVGVARRGLALACSGRRFPRGADPLRAGARGLRARARAGDPGTVHDATGPIVMSVLAVTMWQLGEVDRARELIDQAAPARERPRPRPVDDSSSPMEISS